MLGHGLDDNGQILNAVIANHFCFAMPRVKGPSATYLHLRASFHPREVVHIFRGCFGPMKTAFSRLDPTSQTVYAEELERLWSEHNEDKNGKAITQNEYLEVIGTRL